MIAAAFLVFACAPVFSPPVAPTLDPASLNTLVAQTAGAALAQTAVSGQGLQPPSNVGGPTLDAVGLNTAIAQTAAAAATRTAALIPPTWTPSFTPFPTWTASVMPSPTQTFVFLLPTRTRTPRPAPTSTSSGGGGGGGGGDDYKCAFISVSPALGAVMSKNEVFNTRWTVRNTGDVWPENSTDLVYRKGDRFRAVNGVDLTLTVRNDQKVTLPAIRMRAPGVRGTYTATWSLQIGNDYFCSLPVKIVVK
jgi:hypothetical protein